MKRQSGFYWVKYDGVWDVAFYFQHNDAWLFSEDGCDYLSDEIEDAMCEINETRILAPDEVSDDQYAA